MSDSDDGSLRAGEDEALDKNWTSITKFVSIWDGSHSGFEKWKDQIRSYVTQKRMTTLFKTKTPTGSIPNKAKLRSASELMLWTMLTTLEHNSFPYKIAKSFQEPIEDTEIDLVDAGDLRFYYAWHAILHDYQPLKKEATTLADVEILLDKYNAFSINETDDVRMKLLDFAKIILQLKEIEITKTYKEQLVKMCSMLKHKDKERTPYSLYQDCLREVYKREIAVDAARKLDTEDKRKDCYETLCKEILAIYKHSRLAQLHDEKKKKESSDSNTPIDINLKGLSRNAKRKLSKALQDSDLKDKSREELLVLAASFKSKVGKPSEEKKETKKSLDEGSKRGCTHCKDAGKTYWKGHTIAKCFDLHPELRPARPVVPSAPVPADITRIGIDPSKLNASAIIAPSPSTSFNLSHPPPTNPEVVHVKAGTTITVQPGTHVIGIVAAMDLTQALAKSDVRAHLTAGYKISCEPDEFIVDCGATRLMVGHPLTMSNVHDKQLLPRGGSTTGIGNFNLYCHEYGKLHGSVLDVFGEYKNISLEDAILVPNLAVNLFPPTSTNMELLGVRFLHKGPNWYHLLLPNGIEVPLYKKSNDLIYFRLYKPFHLVSGVSLISTTNEIHIGSIVYVPPSYLETWGRKPKFYKGTVENPTAATVDGEATVQVLFTDKTRFLIPLQHVYLTSEEAMKAVPIVRPPKEKVAKPTNASVTRTINPDVEVSEAITPATAPGDDSESTEYVNNGVVEPKEHTSDTDPDATESESDDDSNNKTKSSSAKTKAKSLKVIEGLRRRLRSELLRHPQSPYKDSVPGKLTKINRQVIHNVFHRNPKTLDKICATNKLTPQGQVCFCPACQIGFGKRLEINKVMLKPPKVFLEIVQIDTSGPYTETRSGKKYALNIWDGATKWKWVEYMSSRGASSYVAGIKSWLKRIHKHPSFIEISDALLAIQADGEKGMTLEQLQDILPANVKVRGFSSYSPEFNGGVEKSTDVLVSGTTCSLSWANCLLLLPRLRLWAECYTYRVFIDNRTPTSGNEDDVSPYRARFGVDFQFQRAIYPFMCEVWVTIPKLLRTKKVFSSKKLRCGFLGYFERVDSRKTYEFFTFRLLSSETGHILVSRNCTFNSSVPYFSPATKPDLDSYGNPINVKSLKELERAAHESYNVLDLTEFSDSDSEEETEFEIGGDSGTSASDGMATSQSSHETSNEPSNESHSDPIVDMESDVETDSATEPEPSPLLDHLPACLHAANIDEYNKGLKEIPALNAVEFMSSSLLANIYPTGVPKDKTINVEDAPKVRVEKMYALIMDALTALNTSIDAIDPALYYEPSSFEDATTCKYSDKWWQSMFDEVGSCIDKLTWELRALPPGATPLTLKWVYKIKLQLNGTIKRYKSRLCVRGFQQILGVNYKDTFSPVVKLVLIRMVLAIAAMFALPVVHSDVDNAFCQSFVEEPNYCYQPQGFVDPVYPYLFLFLLKSLYGMKQSPRNWYKEISTWLKSIGFRVSPYDPCLFIHVNTEGLFLLLALFVDDVLTTGNNLEGLTVFRKLFRSRYAIKELILEQVVGLEIYRNPSTGSITIFQASLIRRALKLFNVDHLKGKDCNTPMDAYIDQTEEFWLPGAETESFYSLYRTLVGIFLYLSIACRPDIANAVRLLCSHMARPALIHWEAAQRVLAYLRDTMYHGITYYHWKDNSSSFFPGIDEKYRYSLLCYSDSAYASHLPRRRSNTGVLIYLARGLIAWICRLHDLLAQSSTEAEYVALSDATNECVFIRRVLVDIFQCDSPLFQFEKIPIFEDNQAAIKLLQIFAPKNRTKHIEVRFHNTRDHQESGEVSVVHISREFQGADMLTKNQQSVEFLRNRPVFLVDDAYRSCVPNTSTDV